MLPVFGAVGKHHHDGHDLVCLWFEGREDWSPAVPVLSLRLQSLNNTALESDSQSCSLAFRSGALFVCHHLNSIALEGNPLFAD